MQLVQLKPAGKARKTKSEEDVIIEQAQRILISRMKKPGRLLDHPAAVRTYLSLTIGNLEHEVFMVLFVDVKNRLIAAEELFRGTLTHTSVYPREVVKRAIAHNASGMLFAHNHPSGDTTPSDADFRLTAALTQACGYFDVRVLDHIVVAGNEAHSMAEHGQM